ncbi:hypothetical protein [Nocardia sienata]|uniref:hypothetical protein n=1 Tax=Nocardia sienata TaxID=248552 RepID=UPI001470CB63|nr:hypothetical protein [Nocardia sienata]
MSADGGDFAPHLDACFPDERERLAFTTALDSSRRPATGEIWMTAEITARDDPDGTGYRVLVRHGDPDTRARHEELGFARGHGHRSARRARRERGAGMKLVLTEFLTLDGRARVPNPGRWVRPGWYGGCSR